MDYQAFNYRNGQLMAENVALAEIATQFGTPCFVYSKAYIANAYQEFAHACEGRKVNVCYALKANSNLAVIDLLAQMGAGFDIVSGGELARVVAAGGDTKKIVFSGVGKSRAEIAAGLEANVMCFNVESEAELERLSDVAVSLGRKARVSLRVNPDVDAKTHPYISTGLKENKFGVAFDRALPTYQRAAKLQGIEVSGIDCHIGSQITQLAPYLDALEKMLDLVQSIEAAGIPIHHIDLGGGLGIQYKDETPPSRGEMLGHIFKRLDQFRAKDKLEVMFEFGRSIVGNAGVLLTSVEYLKPTAAKNFAIVDAAMNDLIRPTLYQAWHGVKPVIQRSGTETMYDLVGPVCESGDWLAKDRALNIVQGDVLAITSAGAYGMAQSSNYNTRPRACEVMVDGDKAFIVRERETLRELFQAEKRLPKGLAANKTANTQA